MKDRYESPLNSRYASREMQYIFSPDFKFRTWRRLWIALAESEQELGLEITNEQIAELKAHQDDVNYEIAQERERLVRHDVMSHVYAYGVQCPKAKPIIHLGRHILLCGRQYGYHHNGRGPASDSQKACEPHGSTRAVCAGV